MPFLFNWRDGIEILFFWGTIYYFLRWLNYDKQKNLLVPVYLYWCLLLGAQVMGLYSISLIVLLTAPALIIFFIILHQETLQKNFIALKNISLEPITNTHWLEELMRSCLKALNNNKETICVIERTDRLADYITAPCMVNAELNAGIVDLLLENSSSLTPTMLWLNYYGKFIAINTELTIIHDEVWSSEELKNVHKWKQDAVILTSKTDAIIMRLSPTTRVFDLIMQGKIIEQLTAGQAYTLIQRSLSQKQPKGTFYANTSTYSTPNQPFS